MTVVSFLLQGCDLIFVVCVGWAGGALFKRARIPAAALLGALVISALWAMTGTQPAYPSGTLSFLSNVAIGLFLGVRLNRESCRLLRNLPGPAILVSGWMLGLSLAMGYLMSTFTSLPLPTAMLGSTAGGITEMALLSLSMGADVASVTLLQIFRLLAAVLTTPVLCRMWMRNHPSPVCCVAEEGDDPIKLVRTPVPSRARLRTNVLCAAAAVAGGLAGKWLSLPAGALIGAMAASGAVTNAAGEPRLPDRLIRTFGQVGVGVIIARSITKEVLLGFLSLLGPLALLTVGMIGGSLLLAVLLHRIAGFSPMTCMLASSPGGLSQIASIADEFGADPVIVSLIQTVRLLSIILVLPPLLPLLMR